MRKLNPRSAFSGRVPDAWQFFITQRIEMAVIQWFGEKIYNDLCNYVPVEVRDEITCFEENFLFKKGIKASWDVRRTKCQPKGKKVAILVGEGGYQMTGS